MAERRARPRRQQGAVARHPSSNTPPRRQPASPRVRRRRMKLATVLGGLALVAFLFAFVYPTSTYLRQRTEVGADHQRIARIDAQTQKLRQENQRLQGAAEVERLAREQYGMVRPGETPYVLVPEATAPTTAPPTTAKPAGK